MARRFLLTLAAMAALAVGAAAQASAEAVGAADPAPNGALPSSTGKRERVSPAVRQRLLELLQLPKEKLWAELVKWPAFQKMTLQEQASFLQRLAEMRQHLRLRALKKASDIGIKLAPGQEDAFVASYLRERTELERQMGQEGPPKRRKLEEQLTANLRAEYASASAAAPVTAPEPTTPR